jgi:hypothetical protein
MAGKLTQQVCFAFEYSHRERLNTNPSSSVLLDGEEQPIAWLTEIQTQRSTSGIFSSGILALLHAHCFSIEHPQKANSPSLHR